MKNSLIALFVFVVTIANAQNGYWNHPALTIQVSVGARHQCRAPQYQPQYQYQQPTQVVGTGGYEYHPEMAAPVRHTHIVYALIVGADDDHSLAVDLYGGGYVTDVSGSYRMVRAMYRDQATGQDITIKCIIKRSLLGKYWPTRNTLLATIEVTDDVQYAFGYEGCTINEVQKGTLIYNSRWAGSACLGNVIGPGPYEPVAQR